MYDTFKNRQGRNKKLNYRLFEKLWIFFPHLLEVNTKLGTKANYLHTVFFDCDLHPCGPRNMKVVEKVWKVHVDAVFTLTCMYYNVVFFSFLRTRAKSSRSCITFSWIHPMPSYKKILSVNSIAKNFLTENMYMYFKRN